MVVLAVGKFEIDENEAAVWVCKLDCGVCCGSSVSTEIPYSLVMV